VVGVEAASLVVGNPARASSLRRAFNPLLAAQANPPLISSFPVVVASLVVGVETGYSLDKQAPSECSTPI